MITNRSKRNLAKRFAAILLCACLGTASVVSSGFAFSQGEESAPEAPVDDGNSRGGVIR